MRRAIQYLGLLAVAATCCLTAGLSSGCWSIRTESEIKPIHITVDVNLRVQKDLDTFFADIDKN